MKNSIKLPDPQKELPFPLMKALAERRSIRRWKDAPVSEQDHEKIVLTQVVGNRE